MKFTAKLAGYSSIVGQSIMLQEQSGRVICQLALLNVGGEDHKASCAKIGQAVVDRINAVDYSSLEVRMLAHMVARWVKTSERQPTVGGSYITGDYIEVLDNHPLHFRKTMDLYCIIHTDGIKWYNQLNGGKSPPVDPPQYWFEGMPAHPEFNPEGV